MLKALYVAVLSIWSACGSAVLKAEKPGATGPDKRAAAIKIVQEAEGFLPIPGILKSILLSDWFVGMEIDFIVKEWNLSFGKDWGVAPSVVSPVAPATVI